MFNGRAYMMNINDLYTRLRQKYGYKMQMIVAVEELSELQKEIIKNLRGKSDLKHLAEEIADVEIMCEQLKLMFKIEPECQFQREKKLQRINCMLAEPEEKPRKRELNPDIAEYVKAISMKG